MNERLQNLTPQARDRMMQVHLAQARGPVRNGDLLIDAIDTMLKIGAARGDVAGGMVVDNALIETLSAVVQALDAVGAEYAVAGSIASSFHGEPQSSIDVDLIVNASVEQAQSLALKLSPRFYAPQDMLMEAAEKHSFVNAVDNRTSLKADLSFIERGGYLERVLGRRVRGRIGSTTPEFWFVTAEDVILMKLAWRKDTRSAKQWENALGVARCKGTRMDWQYLFGQSATLGIEKDLERLRDEAGI
jgi:hypothetical protein